MVKLTAIILMFCAWCTIALEPPPTPPPLTKTTTTTTTTTTTLPPPPPTEPIESLPILKNITDTVPSPPKHTNGLVKIYKVINHFYHYLQSGFDDKLGLHVAHSTSVSSSGTNLLKYELKDYDQNDSDKNDAFVVLRFESSLKYVCLNHCGEFYSSKTLNHDCVFVFENVDNDHDSDDRSFVLAKFMGASDKKMYIKFDKGYYTLTKTKDESSMVLFERKISTSSVMPLTELLDEVNDDDCTINLIEIQPPSTENIVNKKSGSIIADVDKSVLTLSSIIIACVTVVILIIGALLIVFVVLHFKNKKVN
ncbi:fibroblast growth factor-3 [Pseudalatia unipuncta granulovirus]|uniref:Fibroblast growth factor-3 n=1 Tax=Pseudalatia unipuncta granulosis virus TaxID=36355 RepID=B6S749_GVPU|nr:fibroblast growth factor-3 [Pseudalatia unipuncta granulovirus]ACH69530.1 fibroblast growth factor-3 [Pseudalatia unipuncta granulovirus]